ncbi:hypothetical protein FJY94_05850 [Candidatus Kaiserbacteria bacterium]|nr:hypothetical protein [Candidatus Kaiserbacteria bacterium]
MRILFVAETPAAQNAFKLLVEHLGTRHDVHFTDGYDASLFTQNNVLSRDTWGAVVIGMSAPAERAKGEIETARTCAQLGIPFGFFADAHFAWRRDHFAPFRDSASFVFVASKLEVQEAARLFWHTLVVATGNPLWERYFEPGDVAHAHALIGARESDFVILAPGTKNLAVNVGVWRDCTAAAYHARCSDLKGQRTFLVVLAKHPGDRTPGEVYRPLIGLGNSMGRNHMRLILTGDESPRIAADDILPRANVVVNGTALRVHALAQRKPVIDYYGPVEQQWLEDDIGQPFTPLHVW